MLASLVLHVVSQKRGHQVRIEQQEISWPQRLQHDSLPDSLRLQHAETVTRPNCETLQNLVPKTAHGPVRVCERFSSDEACCGMHRVGEQRCRFHAHNRTCRLSSERTHSCRWAKISGGVAAVQHHIRSASPLVTSAATLPKSCAVRSVRSWTTYEATSSRAGGRAAKAKQGLSGNGATHMERWPPSGGAATPWWQYSACEGRTSAMRFLEERTARAIAMCVVPTPGNASYRDLRKRPANLKRFEPIESWAVHKRVPCFYPKLPYCGMACDLRHCRAKSCGPADVRKLIKMSCTARHVEPSALAALALERPRMISRAGSGELKMMEAAAMLAAQNRTVEYLFNTTGQTESYETYRNGRMGELVVGLKRFYFEYSRALAAADAEMLWADQCHGVLFMRCTLSTLGWREEVVRYSPEWASSLRRLSDMRSFINYNMTLDYWLSMLQTFGKSRARLLIVTGFAASVTHQIPKLHLLHPRYNLSGLSFRVLAAPMSSPRLATPGWPLPADPKDENYATNLDKLQASPEWDPRRSDVAILGCGALGLPLARFARERGLSSVYVGGLIQLLFGITGSRYIDRFVHGKEAGGLAHRVLNGNVNEHWIAPLDSETPPNFKDQENGAYW